MDKPKRNILPYHFKNKVPAYIEDSLKLNSDRHTRTTRYSNNNFICPRYNRETEGGKTMEQSKIRS